MSKIQHTFVLLSIIGISACSATEADRKLDPAKSSRCEEILKEKLGQGPYTLVSISDEICTFTTKPKDPSQQRLIGQRTIRVDLRTREVKEVPRR